MTPDEQLAYATACRQPSMDLEIHWLGDSWLPGRCPPLIIWDKDSTLADTRHRQPMVQEIREGRATWVDYSLAAAGDVPVEGAVALVSALSDNHVQLVVTNANVESAPLVTKWLYQHEIPLDGLVMRPAGLPDSLTPAEYKVAAITWLQEQGYCIRLCIEDWAEVAAFIREHTGLPVLLVKGSYLPDVPSGV